MNNPFRVGKAITPEDYVVPKETDLGLIAQRIFNGESTAIVGDPRSGKTSLLLYLASSDIVKALNLVFKDWNLLFQFVDYHLFQRKDIDQADFWQFALDPVEQFLTKTKNASVEVAYSRWKKDSTTFSLVNLFTKMGQSKIRLVLLVDEFDDIITHPILGTNEFLGALRSIATREQSLSIIISSRLEISGLNERTNRDRRPGSPFFNHFLQIILGPFPSSSTAKLLGKAKNVFTDYEKQKLIEFTDHHPYFLQLAASTLWDAYFIKHEANSDIRLSDVWEKLCSQAVATLDDSWDYWTVRIKQVFTIIALDDIPRLLKAKTFDTKSLRDELSNCANEIMFLESRGYIIKNSKDKYALSSHLLLYWLSLKLDASIRNQDEIGHWLWTEHRGGILKPRHREKILEIGKFLVNLIQSNKDVFVEAVIGHILK